MPKKNSFEFMNWWLGFSFITFGIKLERHKLSNQILKLTKIL